MKVSGDCKVCFSTAEMLYYVYFSILLALKGLGFYDGQPVFRTLLVVAVLFWAGKMCLTAYTWREFFIVGLLLVLGGVSYLVSGEKGALLYIFMITGLKNISLKRVFTVGCCVWSLCFVGLIWLNALHIPEGPFVVHEKLGMGMIIRWGLGYSHPNVLHISYLVFIMFLVYLAGDKFSWKWAVVCMLGNLLIYCYSVSNTGVIAVTLYLLLCLYWRYKGKLQAVDKLLIKLTLPVCVLFSLLAPILLTGKAYEIVNDITNTRLRLADHFLRLRPPTLFGVRLSEIITAQLTMDNSYVFAFVTYGIVMFAVIICAYLLIIHKYCKEQKGAELCVMISCFAAGITEPFMFNTSFKNLSLLFMRDILFQEDKETDLRLLSGINRQHEFSFGGIVNACRHMAAVICDKRRLLIIASLTGCLAGALLYQIVKQEPQRILVPENACDQWVLKVNEDSLSAYYLASDKEVPQSTDEVVGYVNAETRMIAYSGGIVWMEHVRGLICSGITLGALLAAAVCLLYYGRNDDRKKGHRDI